ncbi:hypothetical protein [Paludibacter jiangxiensis]|uniref:Uncharacterized protein n=1 Tax=Paludibacter jiangxiensis TaxID=681398 RepID=A0A170YL34_9BACT|nr:hypothetical protein [Paludibacter jiangxiensis]GAT61889.1 hypothetical protein PJIAN_1476 [Paludibacter jiangxiensis]
MKTEFKFYTEYNQFYIHDKNYVGDTSDSDFWSEEAYSGRLAIRNGILGVGTQCYGNVKGEINILYEQLPNNNFDQYDHIVEAGIEIHGGEIQISGCTSNYSEVRIKINNGKYRVRIYSSNLASVLEPDLAHDTDDDFYKIEVWTDENMERKILKQYI